MVAIVNGSIGAFFASFLQYLVIALILAGIAVLGVLVGKKLRENKDKKKALAAAQEEEAGAAAKENAS